MRYYPARRFLRLLAALIGLTAVIFVGYEIIERTWLSDIDEDLRHALHIFRGIGSTLLGASLAFWFFRRGWDDAFPSKTGGIRPLDDRRRVLYVALNMAVVFLFTATTSIYILYRTSFNQQRERLREAAQSKARQIESMARYAAIHTPESDAGGWRVGTISQVVDAHRNFKGFGETGEYLIARREGQNIVFLVAHRHYDLQKLDPVPIGSRGSEPMGRALQGASGTMIGRDYRGVEVLAAFEPIDVLDLGLVAKIDLAEIRSPFVKAALVTGAVSIVVIILGVLIFIWVINPMLRKIEEGQKRLMQSESLAAIGTMAAVVAHEIRNPLGSIVTAAKSLNRGDLGPEDRETLLSVLGTESERLNKTLKDFLEFARPRELRLEPGDLNQVIKEVLQAIRADSSLLGDIVFEENIDEGLARFRFDSDQIRQILWNLILNGIESMGGKGRLRIETRGERGAVRLVVGDTGPGIRPEELEKIFRPFHTTKKQGTGLGLAISQRIVKRHGGRIEVVSRPGEGAEFTVTLPTHPRAAV